MHVNEKDKIIKSLLESKVKLLANRNLRFANIQSELDELKNQLNHRLDDLLKRINEASNINNI